MKLLILAAWTSFVGASSFGQSAVDVVTLLNAQLRQRAAFDTAMACTIDSYMDPKSGIISKDSLSHITQRVSFNLRSLNNWSVSTIANGSMFKWLSDGSGSYAYIVEPVGEGGLGTIRVSPFTLDILTSLVNGDCLLLALASVRNASPNSLKVAEEGDVLVLSGKDSKAAIDFKIKVDKQNFKPLSHEAYTNGVLISKLVSEKGKWKKQMFTSSGELFESQVWTPISVTPLSDVTVQPEFNEIIRPRYSLFIDLPHLKLNGVPSEEFSGLRLKDLVSAQRAP